MYFGADENNVAGVIGIARHKARGKALRKMRSRAIFRNRLVYTLQQILRHRSLFTIARSHRPLRLCS